MQLHTISDLVDCVKSAPSTDSAARASASERNSALTKPPGALGRLEDLALWYAGWRGSERPAILAPQIAIFAGNHGVTARGVSAFPPEVTAQMCANFENGGAAINQLARTFGARLSIHPLQLETPTADFTVEPAMSEMDLLSALQVGWDAVEDATDLLVVGEMGIGNTTAAAALSAALWGGTAGDWAGRGTGLDDIALERKRGVIDSALARHAESSGDPLEALRRLGGRELAAMTGAIAAARTRRIPVILDGFICCAAAAVLARIDEHALDHCVAGHVSAEPGHIGLLGRLGKTPLLDLGLRLGEGSGAALAIAVLQGAIACHSGMATFAEAAVAKE